MFYSKNVIYNLYSLENIEVWNIHTQILIEGP